MPYPSQVILTEAFDEGLMVLRRLMGWEMIDMTYSRMMETKAGSRRWDGKEMKNVPHFHELDPSVSDSVGGNLNTYSYTDRTDRSRSSKDPLCPDLPL